MQVVANRIRRERSDRRLRRERQKQRQTRVDGRAAASDIEVDSEARGLLAAGGDSESDDEPALNESVGLASSRHGKPGIFHADYLHYLKQF